MARRFKRFRRGFSKAKKFYSRNKASFKPLNAVLYGAAYGAVRNAAHTMAQPITNMIPLGQYSDEALFGVVGYFMAKNGNSMVKNAGYAILTVEAASLGQQTISPMIGGMTGQTSSFNGY
jgi:hypothetical protein